MTTSGLPLLDLPLGQRVRRVARNSLALTILGVPLYLAAAFGGGRFQRTHGSVEDTWLLAVLYPIGLWLSAIVGALFGQLWRNRWTAAVAAGVTVLPFFGLISVALSHSGPREPYHVMWPITLGCCGLAMAISPLYYDYWRRRTAEIQERIRRDREAAA